MKAVLFDLDGTLLPMNEEQFLRGYFGRLYKFMAPYGYEKDSFVAGVWYGTNAMRKNDGKRSCEDVYWDAFISQFEGKDKDLAHQKFDEFYSTDFNNTKQYCFEAHENVKQIIEKCREKADLLIVAANPVFPMIAMRERIEFAGLNPDVFDYISSYETSHYAKPNKMFVKEIMDKFNLKKEDVIYFGNSIKEDATPAKELGVKFYLTDNVSEENVDNIPYVDFKDIPSVI